MEILRSANSNPYCVPGALAAITGKHVDDCILMLRDEVGDQPVKGIYHPLILKILKKLNYTYQEVNHIKREGLFLIVYRSHVGIVEESIYFDNNYVKEIPFAHHKGSKMFLVFEITRPSEPALPAESESDKMIRQFNEGIK